MRLLLVRAAVVGALLALMACDDARKKTPEQVDSETVAQVGDKAITAAEFENKIDEQPPLVRSRYKTLDRKKEFLDNLIRFEVLLQEARRRGLESDPEVKAMVEKVLVQRMMQVRQKEIEAAGALPESELRKFYDEHVSEFVRPARVRLSNIFLSAPRGDPNRAKVREEAEKLVADIKTKEAGPNRAAFAQSASSRSDDMTSKNAAGDLGFKTRDELKEAWGEAVANAAMSLKAIGELSAVVESDKGFHLLKLAGRQEGVEQPFEAVKARIESRLALERRSRALDDFVGDLKSKASVKIDEKALERVDVDSGAVPSPNRPLGGQDHPKRE